MSNNPNPERVKMADPGTISTSIERFILQKFPAAKKQKVTEQVPLLQSGIVDSLGVLDIVGYLEQTFSIRVADEELSPENFATIRSLATFVEKKQAEASVAG
jgi:acyl carrier protein